MPLVTVGALGVIHGLTQGGGPDGIYGPWPVFIIVAAGLLAILAPEISARMAPFALLAFGAWGVYLVHFMRFDGYNGQLYYGVVHVAVHNRLVPASGATFQRALGGFAGTLTPVSSGVWDAWWNNGRLGLVLAEALAFLAAGVWLLALTRAPGGAGVRRAAMAAGRSNAAIAARLFITEKAVSKHAAGIFTRLGLALSDDDNRRVLAVLAYLNS